MQVIDLSFMAKLTNVVAVATDEKLLELDEQIHISMRYIAVQIMLHRVFERIKSNLGSLQAGDVTLVNVLCSQDPIMTIDELQTIATHMPGKPQDDGVSIPWLQDASRGMTLTIDDEECSFLYILTQLGLKWHYNETTRGIMIVRE